MYILKYALLCSIAFIPWYICTIQFETNLGAQTYGHSKRAELQICCCKRSSDGLFMVVQTDSCAHHCLRLGCADLSVCVCVCHGKEEEVQDSFRAG